MWEIRITHEGLHTFRVVRAPSKEEAELKARLQRQTWADRWSRVLAIQARRKEQLARKDFGDKQTDVDKRNKAHALELTREAETAIAELGSLLTRGLQKANALEWDAIKDTSPFRKDQPTEPALQTFPKEPLQTDDEFSVWPVRARIIWADWLIPKVRRRKIAAAEQATLERGRDAKQRFQKAHDEWKKKTDEIDKSNHQALTNYEKSKAAYALEKHVFKEQQHQYNKNVDVWREEYSTRAPEAIVRYATEVLARSEYPDSFPRDCLMSFDKEAGLLAVDFELPPQGAIPTKKHVKYVANRGEFQESFISDSEFKRHYDEVVYQICLRTLRELFSSDRIDAIKTIVFNGWVHAIDKATGADIHPCIMTVQVAKNEFMALNLEHVDLKACFRSLRGISGGKLSDFSPVRPVLSLNRDDPRFVGSYNLAESLTEKTNLAAMDWLDFENLIRELFEKEFSKNGGEVKITQASRDGGVDAIAFDPDPIRGGKIVIQAKRYTNTVGVSAVRDLFGTVHNEGATKGILVTTSDYGPDAYEFAKGKPLTLLSGSELLYLLGRHGYHAKIDIKEAKTLLGET